MADVNDCRDEIEFPGLHGAASKASRSAQQRYVKLIRLKLVSLLIGAFAGVFMISADTVARIVAGIGAVALITALLATLVIQNKGYERTWYGGRAVAESVKTLAWRYMTRAEPFDTDAETRAGSLFLGRLEQILQHGTTLNVKLSAAEGDQINARMREVRASPWENRRELYVRCRIAAQRIWYARNAESNERAEQRFFTTMWISNGLAVATAVVHVIWPLLPVNPIGFFSTAAAAALAWLQVRRHQELAQSYAIATQELAIIQAKAATIEEEVRFTAFVADAESAISREHTLWAARRDAVVKVA